MRNGWTAEQAESGLLSRWSERPENDCLVDLLALKLTATGSNGTLKSTHCLTYCLYEYIYRNYGQIRLFERVKGEPFRPMREPDLG